MKKKTNQLKLNNLKCTIHKEKFEGNGFWNKVFYIEFLEL